MNVKGIKASNLLISAIIFNFFDYFFGLQQNHAVDFRQFEIISTKSFLKKYVTNSMHAFVYFYFLKFSQKNFFIKNGENFKR